MKRFALTALLAIAAAPVLHAQGAVVLPDQPLDSNRAAVRDAVYVLRDTLQPVTAAVARLQRDFRTTSPQSLTSRARDLSRACAAAARNLPATRGAVAKTASGSRLQRNRQVQLEAALGALEKELTGCHAEFTTLGERGHGEDVRGYGNRRAEPIRDEIRKYESAVDGFFRAMKIPHRPLGAGPDPLAR